MRTGTGRALLARIVPHGNGPSERQVTGGNYRLDVTGTAKNGRQGRVTMTFDGDPGNYVTALCAAQIALALCLDEATLPDRVGVLTPSTSIGGGLADRLVAAGMHLTGATRATETAEN